MSSQRAPATASASAAPIVEVTQRFQFSAAHRMHNPRLSAARNRRLYGRCNHPQGHGHTYRLAVTVRGPIEARSGRLALAAAVPAAVRTRVLARFDLADLDRLLTPADGVTSTTEVLAGRLWRILDRALPPGRLWRLRLEETPNNFFELDRLSLETPGRPARRTGIGKRVLP
jgi:6-pyruvoyltetrahydropterin/6-carboxytetrahydropterin synthase